MLTTRAPSRLSSHRHSDFDAHAADDKSSQVLKILARGLEKNQTSEPLWLLYLHCYSMRLGTAGAVKIGELPTTELARINFIGWYISVCHLVIPLPDKIP